VRLVWAYGRARTTTHDSLSSDEDWMTGDTLRADFAVKPDSGGAVRKSELEHLTSFGSARALYHVDNAEQPKGPRGINYSRGKRIDIAMHAAIVATVDVVGQVDGVYLEPLPPRPDTTRAAADSTRRLPADSTRPAPADSTRPAPAATGKPRPGRRP
jgi:hypothetical protein